MDVFHPASYTNHSLSPVRRTVACRSWDCAHVVTQSRDCTHALRNLEIAHTCYAIPRLPAQSRDSENAQIPRLHGTYTLSQAHTHMQLVGWVGRRAGGVGLGREDRGMDCRYGLWDMSSPRTRSAVSTTALHTLYDYGSHCCKQLPLYSVYLARVTDSLGRSYQ